MATPARAKVRWGVLGTARIAVQKVTPAMQRGECTAVVAIASRDLARARDAASRLGIHRAHGSYDALLDDPEVDAVYIALPNHRHVEWAVRAADAGKHVLCEKPIGLTAPEAETLPAARDRTGVVIQEAFMIRAHPQWQRAIAMIRSGRIGEVRAVTGDFHYFNVDPANIRNVAAVGGGGLLDIGCYLTHVSRWIFNREPDRVLGTLEQDPVFQTDRFATLLLDFGPAGRATCTCGTQGVPFQRVQVLGTSGRIEVEIPFNAPNDRPCRLFVDDGSDVSGSGIETAAVDVCDQYTLQGDAFARAVRGLEPPLVPLEDSIANMRVLDAIRQSAASGDWQELQPWSTWRSPCSPW